jgi:hypothetical protein
MQHPEAHSLNVTVFLNADFFAHVSNPEYAGLQLTAKPGQSDERRVKEKGRAAHRAHASDKRVDGYKVGGLRPLRIIPFQTPERCMAQETSSKENEPTVA